MVKNKDDTPCISYFLYGKCDKVSGVIKKLNLSHTYHVQPLPNVRPFPQNEGDLADDRIFHRDHALEKPLIVDLAGLQVDVRLREYALDRPVLRGESPVPSTALLEDLDGLPDF